LNNPKEVKLVEEQNRHCSNEMWYEINMAGYNKTDQI
jgi:hypothetical protein